MEQYQQLNETVHSLDDIWSSFSAQYSTCCVHVINNGQNLDIAAIKAPILVSRGAPDRPYPSELLHALHITNCLLTILSLSVSELNKDYFLHMLDKRRAWGFLQKISPQELYHSCHVGDHVAALESTDYGLNSRSVYSTYLIIRVLL